ncbi:MAG: DUF4339 domain-containing protein [Bacteroidota bacterium]
MKKYFLHTGTEQQGPFSPEELKNLHISRDIMLWHDGLGHWTPAGNIEELQSIFTTVPPLFVAAPVTPGLPETEVKSRRFGRKTILIVGAILILALIGILVFQQIEYQEYRHYRMQHLN